jgi:hypothetical protein
MKHFKNLFLIPVMVIAVIVSCKDDEPTPAKPGDDTGKLKLTLSAIAIDESPAGGRVKEVSTDNFIVKIFKIGEVEPVEVFDPWSSAPESIELETGEYFVEAQNLDPAEEAAFDQPWYYGVSDEFTIDKEELKEIAVECSMANYKVSFHYSENVLENFTTWSATATRAVTGASLAWPQGEEREGYFLTGEPLSVHVHLEYEKEFDDDVITRDFYATIADPAAATLYRLNVDAVLQDGEIQLEISVDDGFETVDIDLMSSVTFSGPGTVDDIPGGATVEGSGPPQGFGKGIMTWDISDVWRANDKFVYWGPAPDLVRGKAGADNNFNDGDPNEVMDFNAAQSNLGTGLLVFSGTTRIAAPSGGFQAVELRFELQVVGRSLVSPASLGLPSSIGGLVELNDINDEVQVQFQLLARGNPSQSFVPWLTYYDSQPKAAGLTAYSSFTGGFYWSNTDK